LIPRLHRFYGRAPGPDGDWLKLKPQVLGMYATMLPRLEAHERLDSITDQLASGNRMLEDHSRQRFMGGLERQMVGQRRPKRATAEDFASMKVQVVVEKDGEGGSD
jgi:hypothetical protein